MQEGNIYIFTAKLSDFGKSWFFIGSFEDYFFILGYLGLLNINHILLKNIFYCNFILYFFSVCLFNSLKMPKRGRSNISGRREAILRKQRRTDESAEQREARLETNRASTSLSRAHEPAEQREERLQRNRAATSSSRTLESVEQREERLQRVRAATSSSRALESVEQREERLRRVTERTSSNTAQESLQQREERLGGIRETTTYNRAQETLEQREERQNRDRTATATHRSFETVEQHEERLRNVRVGRTTRQLINQNRALQSVNDEEVLEHSCGSFETLCRNCGAIFFLMKLLQIDNTPSAATKGVLSYPIYNLTLNF